GINDITLNVCSCCPAAILLLELRLFPSVPIHPTLVINLDLLDFTSTVFKVEQPNIHPWVS
ncbi:hypothetical protein BS47DRAFT_1282569, partial [Hydnum rufescens UP504]